MFYFIFLYLIVISVLISVDCFSKTFLFRENFGVLVCGRKTFFCGGVVGKTFRKNFFDFLFPPHQILRTDFSTGARDNFWF